MFHNLYKGTSELPEFIETLVLDGDNEGETEIYGASAYKMEDLKPNHIMIADNKLLDEVYNM